jgi:hypothetical protein
MACAKCGLHVPERADRCPNCLNAVRREGLLGRLFAGLRRGAPAAPAASTTIRTTETHTERIRVQDPKTGEVVVYESLDELPAAMRETIEAARRAAGSPGIRTKITVTDASGTTRTYGSVEEMPDEIRKIYERALHQRTS